MTCPEREIEAAHAAVDAMDLDEPNPAVSTDCDPGCTGPIIEVRSGTIRQALHRLVPRLVEQSVEVRVCPRAGTLQTP